MPVNADVEVGGLPLVFPGASQTGTISDCRTSRHGAIRYRAR